MWEGQRRREIVTWVGSRNMISRRSGKYRNREKERIVLAEVVTIRDKQHDFLSLCCQFALAYFHQSPLSVMYADHSMLRLFKMLYESLLQYQRESIGR